jgi:hypothetical protein
MLRINTKYSSQNGSSTDFSRVGFTQVSYLPTFALSLAQTLYPLAADGRLKIACLVNPHTLCESHIPELGVNPLYDAPSSPSSRPDMHSLTSTSILHHNHHSIPTKLATKHENKMCKCSLHVPPCRKHCTSLTVLEATLPFTFRAVFSV